MITRLSDVKLNDNEDWIKEDKAFYEWLQSVRSESYQKSCKNNFKKFIEYLKEKHPEKKLTMATRILELRKKQDKSDDKKVKHWFADELPKYRDWLIEKEGLRPDSATAYTTPVRGFFKSHRYPLLVRKGAIPEAQGTLGDHTFTQDQLKRMLAVGDARERAILLAGKDLGLRVSDFSHLKRSLILPQIERSKQEGKEPEYPLEFEVMTEKTKVAACCHVMKETVDALLTYWEIIPESEYWFPNGDDSHITPRQLNYTLRKLWSIAYRDPKVVEKGVGKKTSGRIRWHGLRDFLISAMANAKINKWAIKLMTGKKVSKDMREYLSGLDKKALFRQVEPRIVLGGLINSSHARISDLERLQMSMGRVLFRMIKEDEPELYKKIAKSLDTGKMTAAQLAAALDKIAKTKSKKARTA